MNDGKFIEAQMAKNRVMELESQDYERRMNLLDLTQT